MAKSPSSHRDCCAWHGCAHGVTCPVFEREVPQLGPCELCSEPFRARDRADEAHGLTVLLTLQGPAGPYTPPTEADVVARIAALLEGQAVGDGWRVVRVER